MAVHETDIIDIVTIGEDRTVTLSVADHLAWDEETAHLAKLQAKLNRYVDFIDSGELVDKFPEAADHRPLIRVHFIHAPTSVAEAFLARARSAIEADGIGFSYGLIESEAKEVS